MSTRQHEYEWISPDGTRLYGSGDTVSASGPIALFVHGFRSDHQGLKARHLADCARSCGWPWLGFDLRGHGRSEGRPEDLYISHLFADLRTVLADLAPRPVILIGSSLGGWLAVLAAQALPGQVKGLLLIAPAFNFIQQRFGTLPPETLNEWRRDGGMAFRDPYAEGEYRLDFGILQDAEDHNVFRTPLVLSCPVTVIHGRRDEAVPPAQTERFLECLTAPRQNAVWVEAGDHRLHDGLDALCQQFRQLWHQAFPAENPPPATGGSSNSA